MILGLSLLAFTIVHTTISLVAVIIGFVVLAQIIRNDECPEWTGWFLGLTVMTSATGFLFPFVKVTPGHIVGAISLVVLALSIAARYAFGSNGAWRIVFVVTAVAALYLNTFVAVAQAFLKVPALHELAPNGNEPPFAVAQGIVLLGFIAAGFVASKRYHPAPPAAPAAA